ncbi:MAG: hypothetical protein IJ828_01360 [Treponema sp.]|nr:hypothetical protein [Treponema sp.]
MKRTIAFCLAFISAVILIILSSCTFEDISREQSACWTFKNRAEGYDYIEIEILTTDNRESNKFKLLPGEEHTFNWKTSDRDAQIPFRFKSHKDEDKTLNAVHFKCYSDVKVIVFYVQES